MEFRSSNLQKNLLYSSSSNSTTPTPSSSGYRQLLFPPPPVEIQNHSNDPDHQPRQLPAQFQTPTPSSSRYRQLLYPPSTVEIQNRSNDLGHQPRQLPAQSSSYHSDELLPPTLPLQEMNELQRTLLSLLDPNRLINQNTYMQESLSKILPLLNTNQPSVREGQNNLQNLNPNVNFAQSTEKLEINNLSIENKNDSKGKQVVSLKRKSEDMPANQPATKRSRTRETRVITATIDKVIQWNKTMPAMCFVLYEVIAACISIRDSHIQFQKNLLLKDERGPVLQVTYYETDLPLDENIKPGVVLRCVGRMVSSNRLVAYKIKIAPENLKLNLPRLTFKSEHVINRIHERN